jgi:WD40 repeat protein
MNTLLKILILLTLTAQSHGQTMKVEKYFEWYSKNYIINNPSFAHSDTEFVFSKQFNIPDGGNAIGRDKYLQDLLIKAKKDKRFADPIVSIINLKTKKLTAIDYGWTPSFSNDDNLILYAFQTEPITGYRVLAQTTKGNKIKIYNRTKKLYEVVATPNKTFLLDPEFFDPSSISYKLGAAVNGSYSAGIGLNIINLLTKKTDTILRPNQKFGNFPLVGAIQKYNNDICFTLCEPQDSFTYRHLLLRPKGVIIDFGEGYLKNLDLKVAISKQNNILYLDDDHDHISDTNFLIKYNQNIQVSKKPLLFEYHNAYLSPNGQYMFYDDYKSNFYLINLETFEKVKIVLPDSEIHSVTWSPDYKKFAVVQDHETISDTDKIRMFKIR